MAIDKYFILIYVHFPDVFCNNIQVRTFTREELTICAQALPFVDMQVVYILYSKAFESNQHIFKINVCIHTERERERERVLQKVKGQLEIIKDYFLVRRIN